MIEFKNISKSFRKNFWQKDQIVLDDVSFNINKGDLVGFLGANGAGKTTLIKILMGFTTEYSGQVNFSSDLGEDFKTIKSNIGFLPERAYLYPHLTGREYLDFLINISGTVLDFELKLKNLSEKLSIHNALDKKIGEYSKGMQQRLGFLGAILNSPKIIILDEPLSGLDPIGRRDFKKILQSLNKEGTTIFFTSHVVSDVEEICNKVVFIEGSKLVYEGSVRKLLQEHENDKFKLIYTDGIEEFCVEDLKINKSKIIKNVIEQNNEIILVEDDKTSLEEIIYKIKK